MKKHKFLLKNDFKMLGEVARLAPGYIVLIILHALLWAFINSLAIYFRNDLFDLIETDGAFETAALHILFMAIFYLIIFIPDFMYNNVISPILSERLTQKFHLKIFKKAESVDLECFDNPDFYNNYIWTMNQAGGRALGVIDAFANVVNNIISTCAISGLLLTINVWVGIIMIAGIFTTTTIVTSINNRFRLKQNEEEMPVSRKYGYIWWLFASPYCAKEMRIGRTSEIALRDYDDNAEKNTQIQMKYGRKYIWINGVFMNIFERATNYVTIVIMIVLLAKGRFSLGDFAAVVGALWILKAVVQALSSSLSALPDHARYLEKYYAFFAYENKVKSGSRSVPHFENLRVENVSFSYPTNEDKEILHNVSFSINKGEKVAIVGYNGAGKTTLIKLLMRFYDPTNGRILYNGIDIREFDLAEYRNRLAAVFQDYVVFENTVGENVIGGKFDEKDKETVEDALRSAMFDEKLKTLPGGLDTVLSRRFSDEGVNLSGGEEQKVVIARTLAKPYNLIFMDEPSSALDPVAEYNLNHSILNATKDSERTVVFISHRLSTTRFADKIILFENGSIAEIGSHDELMRYENGKYAKMFTV